MESTRTRTSRAPSETLAIGESAGRCASSHAFLALLGPLGSGKTLLVKGLARGLDVPDWDLVSSPTFNLVARYSGRVPLVHVDAYRLSSPLELLDLGFEEWASQDGVTAFEWADRAGTLLPTDRLEVRFDHESESVRRITLEATGPRSRELLEAMDV